MIEWLTVNKKSLSAHSSKSKNPPGDFQEYFEPLYLLKLLWKKWILFAHFPNIESGCHFLSQPTLFLKWSWIKVNKLEWWAFHPHFWPMKYLLSLSPSPTVNRCYPPTPCFTNNAPPPFFIFFALNDKVLGFQLTNHMRALGKIYRRCLTIPRARQCGLSYSQVSRRGIIFAHSEPIARERAWCCARGSKPLLNLRC